MRFALFYFLLGWALSMLRMHTFEHTRSWRMIDENVSRSFARGMVGGVLIAIPFWPMLLPVWIWDLLSPKEEE